MVREQKLNLTRKKFQQSEALILRVGKMKHLGPHPWHRARWRAPTGQEETDMSSRSTLLATTLGLMASCLGKFICKFHQHMSGKPYCAQVIEGIVHGFATKAALALQQTPGKFLKNIDWRTQAKTAPQELLPCSQAWRPAPVFQSLPCWVLQLCAHC